MDSLIIEYTFHRNTQFVQPFKVGGPIYKFINTRGAAKKKNIFICALFYNKRYNNTI